MVNLLGTNAVFSHFHDSFSIRGCKPITGKFGKSKPSKTSIKALEQITSIIALAMILLRHGT